MTEEEFYRCLFTCLGIGYDVPSVWALPESTGFAYTAPRGSFWRSWP